MTSSLSIIYHILLTGCLIAVSSGQSARIAYSFTEENRESLTLGNVAEDSGILAENTDIQVDDARYIFFGEASPHRDLFEIDATTGDLRVRESVDRDLPSVCEGRELCEVSLDISARFGSQNFILGVDVTILDINDNEPIFDERMTSGTLSEDANIGDLLTLETANDRDSPHYGIRTYQLQQTQPETFSLLVTNTSGGHYVQLVLQSELDREVQDAYALQLFAVDGGSPALTGTLQVQVIVGDENDNRPVFQNSTYEVYVAENILPDATVITVQADDADSRQNARIVYGFNDRTEQAYGSMFQIDPHSGLVSTSSALDFALGPTIELGLTASDSDTNLPSTATLFVNIVDLNDNPPSITVNSPTMDGHFTVQEHREIGIFVGHITVIDRDGGDNGRFTCSLSSAFFNLRPYPGLSSEFEIATLTSLDRESIPQHQLTMRCSDQGSPPLTSTEIINIDVTDVNDHTPTFTRQRYIVELAENSPPGTYLTTVSATDDDSGQNSLLTYSMLGSAADLFEINAATGEITTKSRLDYEIEPRIELGVMVDDSGEIPKSDTAVVAISVLDIDDEPPQFHQPSYTFSIFENNAPGYELGNLTASDPDTPGSGSTQTFVYSLDPSTNPDGLFHIDSLTGTLSVNRPLDAESRAQYHVYARAVSRVTVPPQSSHVQVLIIVRDINDNPPYIQYPSPGNNTIHIDGDQSTGSVVTQIRALDVDQSTSGSENLLYVISAGNQKGLFAVEERTGIIHTSTSMSPYVGERYSLLLTVYDQGVPPRRTNTTLTVLIDSPGSGAVKPGQSGGSNGIVTDRNLVIVIAIACVTGVIVVILLVGIVAVLRRRHHVNNGGKYNYKAHMVDQRVLVGGGSINSTNGSGSRRGSVDHKNVDTGVHSTHEGEDAVSDLWAHEKQQQPYGNHGQHNDSFLTQNSDRATPVHGNHRTQHPHNHRQMQPLDLPLHDLGLKDAGSDIEQVSNTDSGRGSNEDVGTHSPRGSNQPGTSHKAPATHRNRPSTSSWREGEFRHPIATNDLHPGMYPGGPEDYPPPTLHPRASRTPSIQSQNSQQMQANQMPRNELPVRSQSDRTKSLYKGQRNTNQDRHYKPSTNQNRPYWDHVTLQEQDEMMPSHV